MMTMSDQTQQPHTETADDIAEGIYDAQAVGEDEPHVAYGQSKNDNDQVAIEMKLLDLNRTVMVILSFSDAAAPFSLERLRALGWKGGDTMAGITANKVPVRAKWDHYTDQQGVAKRSMKFEILTGGGRFSFQKPMDDGQKRGFFARLNQIASQEKPKAGAGGYPADWDKPGPAQAGAGKPPRVDLG